MIEGVDIAVVTGGGHGIGRAIVRRLREEGAEVVVADIDGSAAERVARETGGHAIAVDVAVEAELEDLVRTVERDLGPIDLFVSNAGVGYGDADGMAASARGGVNPIDDRWQVSWQVNVMAHVYAARALVPRMIARGGGKLVTVASAAGLLSQVGDAAYSATKAAAVSFAESLAIAHGEDGIHVAVVCPQAVATRMIGMPDDSVNSGGGFGGNDVDGILEPGVVAAHVVDAIREKRFLVLPHPEVAEYVCRKAADRDRWIGGMQRFRQRLKKPG